MILVLASKLESAFEKTCAKFEQLEDIKVNIGYK